MRKKPNRRRPWYSIETWKGLTKRLEEKMDSIPDWRTSKNSSKLKSYDRKYGKLCRKEARLYQIADIV